MQFMSRLVITRAGLAGGSDPYQVAHSFIRRLVKGQEYRIRKDSYTDRSSGITHIYAKQLVNGVEVVDGDINLNIKDGVVISYGNSFYQGPTLKPFEDAQDVLHPHTEFCQQLGPSSQVIFAADHCNGIQEIPYQLPGAKDIADPRSALLQFMLQATPNVQLHADILSDYDAYLEKMSLVYSHSFVPSSPELTISHVPDTVNPVKAKLAYSQVPNRNGNGMSLQLVWHFEVEMMDNWYETTVSASAPHRIISVVDWASDASPEGASYQVFAWGINDPSCGNRSTVKEEFDALASPMGWHSIPFSVDPSITSVRRPVPTPEFWRNTTTTWGNNVFAQENWEGLNSFIPNYRPNSPT
jgi:extracellular elastinolytic metalloproteinase